jgi:hypothetical protein
VLAAHVKVAAHRHTLRLYTYWFVALGKSIQMHKPLIPCHAQKAEAGDSSQLLLTCRRPPLQVQALQPSEPSSG